MDKINRPPQLSGTAEDKIAQMWDYLVKMTDDLNGRLNGIGRNELTNDEREVMRPLMEDEMKSGRMISMKDMIIGLADYTHKGIKDAKNKANAALAIGKGFVDGKDCGSGTNFNDLTEQGTYYFTGASAQSSSNAPSTAAMSLYVVRRRNETDTVNQFAVTGSNIYRRHNGESTESGWSSWVQYV